MSVLTNYVDNVLFLEAFRNLNWSRGYSWYAILDGVPNPFHNSGVIGLPATQVNFGVVSTESFTWNAGIDGLSVPLKKSITNVQLTLIDDEQATMFNFFERWFNNVYNSQAGVLPLYEACKQLTLYKLKSTRSKVSKTYYNYDMNTLARIASTKQGTNLLVYPSGNLIENEQIKGEPREYSIDLTIANQENADYGNPTYQASYEYSSDTSSSSLSSGSNFLSRLADYI